MSSNKRIAKNTMFLYLRMFLIMGITLYTSRVVLEELGVSDYGIYNLVGGIVAMIGFFNGAMSSATQRYLAHDLGRRDLGQLKKTFSATLTIHFGIATIGFLLAETLGLWYVNKIMVFPVEKTYAVNVVYQFSIFTFLLSIVQVPFNALIMAHERMKVYAYMSILEAVLKLGAVLVLMLLSNNKLITYAILTFAVSFVIRMLYQVYCRKQFPESRYVFVYDKIYYKELVSYSGWNLFGNIAAVAKGQGVNLVLNLFFGTVVNAAYAITNQVVAAVNMFSSNLQAAFNPQIIKNYAQGNLTQSHKLIFQGSKISFLLLLLLIMPILLNTDYILSIWLGTVPEYTTLFVQLALVGILIDSLSGTLMTGMQATGNIKWYQIVVGGLLFLNLPIGYWCLKIGFEPSVVFAINIAIAFISLQCRLFFLSNSMGFSVLRYYCSVFFRVLLVALASFGVLSYIKMYMIVHMNFFYFIIEAICSGIVILLFIILFGLDKIERNLLINIVKNKLIK